MKYKISGPLEKDIQESILKSLGAEVFRRQITKKTGKVSWVRSGIYVSRDGLAYYWRANSGKRVYSYTTKSGKQGRGLFKAAPTGTADILGVVCGISVALEVKREDGKQSEDQAKWQQIHEAAGGVYRVVRSPGEAKAVEQEIRQMAEVA